MTVALEHFRVRYAAVVRDHVADPSEATLRRAYELGRRAVEDDLGVLELATVHHDALADVLRNGATEEAPTLARAAGDVLRESLSAFEMVRRGFQEAHETVILQRREADMVRQLSTFLADASLALDAPDSLQEMLRLVAEEARELIPAGCCVMAVQPSRRPDLVRAVSCDDEREAMFAAVAARLELHALRTNGPSPLHLEARELAGHPALTVADALDQTDRPLGGWLAARLTGLDGRSLGSIQLFDSRAGAFSDVDEAVIVHLAQMAAAAVERALLHGAAGAL